MVRNPRRYTQAQRVEENSIDLLADLLAVRETQHLRFGRHSMLIPDIVQAIAGDIGMRPAGSHAEAKTATYMASLWQMADVLHWSDSFVIPGRQQPTTVAVAVVSMIVTLLALGNPAVAVVVALIGVGLAFWPVYRDIPVQRSRRETSQNVIAIRKTKTPPRRRVVFVAPLDTFKVADRFSQPRQRFMAMMVQFGLVLLAALDPNPVAQLVPLAGFSVAWLGVFVTIYLGVAAMSEQRIRQLPTRGAVSHAGALAVLARVMDELDDLQHTEIWAVATGAGTSSAGIIDLMQRYPFDARSTFFVGLSGLGRGTLSYVIYDQHERGRSIDPFMLEILAELQPYIEIDARTTKQPSILRPLMRQHRRCLDITCVDETGFVPLQGSPQDTIEVVSMPMLERSVRVCTMMVRAVDALN
jgi:hypothetical protein